MTRVQQKFHWDTFGVITLSDPALKADLPFTVFMQMLEGDLSGVRVDLAQGQMDQARQHAVGLTARYAALQGDWLKCDCVGRSLLRGLHTDRPLQPSL
jgi:hypothetical protein